MHAVKNTACQDSREDPSFVSDEIAKIDRDAYYSLNKVNYIIKKHY
jgi:hypothetical protein